MDASNKQETTAEKFARVWEKKNAKAARAGGVSLMALSLAACGGSSEEAAAPVVEAPAEPEAPAVTAVALTATTATNIFDADDFTTANDTVTADQDTYGDADVIAEPNSSDSDTLTVTADADITATPTVVGIENINFVGAFFAAAGNGLDVDLDGIAGGTVTISHDQIGSGIDTAGVTNAGNVTVVAGSNVTTLTVSQKEDAATVTNAGDATTLNLDTANGAFGDQAVTAIVNGNITLDIDDGTANNAADGGEITDLNISATAAATVTLTGAEDLDTVTGSGDASLIELDMGAATEDDLNGWTVSGISNIVFTGGSDTNTATIAEAQDVTGIATDVVLEIDTAGDTDLQIASGAQILLTTVATQNLNLSTDDGATAVSTNGTVTITMDDGAAAAGAGDLRLLIDDTDGSDTISTVNLVATENVDLQIDMLGAADDGAQGTTDGALTVNVSGAGDVDTTAAGAGGGWTAGTGSVLNAANLTGALTASTAAGLLSITGGSGDDTLTAGTNAAVVDGGAGDDTITVGAALTSGTVSGGAGTDTLTAAAAVAFNAVTLSGFEILDTTGGASDFDASQITGQTWVVTAGTNIEINAADAVNVSTIDLSGLTHADATDTVTAVLGNQDGTVFLGGQAITYTGSDASDVVTASANGDTINGGAGDDNITGGAGADTITAGGGVDEIIAAGGDTIDLTETTAAVDHVVFAAITSGSAAGTAGGTFADYNIVTGFTSTSDIVRFDAAYAFNAAVTTAVIGNAAGDSQVVASTAATTASNDLTATTFTDVDSVVSFLNDGGYTDSNTGVADVSSVAVTFADFTAIYAINNNATDAIVASEVTLVATVDAVLVANDIDIV